MIRELTLKLGPPGEGPLVVEPGAVTVIVGPNKAGKTTLLEECDGLLDTAGCTNPGNRLIDSMRLALPRAVSVRDQLARVMWSVTIEPVFRRLSELDAVRSPTEDELSGLAGLLEAAEAQIRLAQGGIEAIEGDVASNVRAMRRARALHEVIDDLARLRREGHLTADGWPMDTNVVPEPSEIVEDLRSTVNGDTAGSDIATMVAVAQEWLGFWASLDAPPGVKAPLRGSPAPGPGAIWPAAEALWLRGWLSLEALAPAISPSTTFLEGFRRLGMLRGQKLGPLLAEPKTPAELLFRSPEHLQRLNRLCRPVLEGHRLMIDAVTQPGLLRFVLSTGLVDPPQAALTRAAAEFFASCPEPTDFSRGLQAFVGLNIALVTEDVSYNYIDEPEAFLHPSLARHLGCSVAQLASERDVQTFVATHSEHFLMGCVDSGQPLSIIRLHNAPDGQFAWSLSADDVAEMMNDPLLRSSDVLQGLFCRHAIVVEGETDRAFYSEINLRLGADGLDDVVFPTAFGKQAMHRIVDLLRRVGVRTAAIVDVDVLTSGTDMKKLLKAQNVPQPVVDGLTSTQAQTWRLCHDGQDEKAVKKTLKRNGLAALAGDARKSMRMLIHQLAEHGLFVVPVGEVEGWLRHLTDDQSPQKGPDWLVHIFERMGRADRPRIEPADDDVWRFIRGIRAWMHQPREG